CQKERDGFISVRIPVERGVIPSRQEVQGFRGGNKVAVPRTGDEENGDERQGGIQDALFLPRHARCEERYQLIDDDRHTDRDGDVERDLECERDRLGWRTDVETDLRIGLVRDVDEYVLGKPKAEQVRRHDRDSIFQETITTFHQVFLEY